MANGRSGLSTGRFGSRTAGSFRWYHVPKSGSVVVVPVCEGWVDYDAHYTGGRYVRCIGMGCVGCDRLLPIYRRMVLGVWVEGKEGKWAVELPENAGCDVADIRAARGRISRVPIRLTRRSSGSRTEVSAKEVGGGALAEREEVDGGELVRWLTGQRFWRGEGRCPGEGGV